LNCASSARACTNPRRECSSFATPQGQIKHINLHTLLGELDQQRAHSISGEVDLVERHFLLTFLVATDTKDLRIVHLDVFFAVGRHDVAAPLNNMSRLLEDFRQVTPLGPFSANSTRGARLWMNVMLEP
jgi:hypothetical protein